MYFSQIQASASQIQNTSIHLGETSARVVDTMHKHAPRGYKHPPRRYKTQTFLSRIQTIDSQIKNCQGVPLRTRSDQTFYLILPTVRPWTAPCTPLGVKAAWQMIGGHNGATSDVTPRNSEKTLLAMLSYFHAGLL